MFTDNHMELKVKYGYYNFLPEKLIVICRDKIILMNGVENVNHVLTTAVNW
jgi:hypothetical protein